MSRQGPMSSPGKCLLTGMRCFHAVKVLRSCLNPSLRLTIPAGQKCMHAAATLQKDLHNLDTNPFYDKYKEKIEEIHGASSSPSPSKARTRVVEEKTQSNTTPSPHPVASFSYTKSPTLDSVMHLGMIHDKSCEEIAQIWLEYHKTKDCISAVIPAGVYVQLHTKALHCPFFLYPVPRDEGYEFFYGQFSGHRCFFTSLINYQMYLENAPVCLTLTHYTDLQDSKGIVLMAGEVDTKSLTTFEAQFLANQVQLYYASRDQERYSLVHQFNHSPQGFDYSSIITQLQNSGIKLQKESNNS